MSRAVGRKENPPAPVYDPSSVEEKWYHYWEKQGFFRAESSSPKKPFCIVIPPPNVTGSLHLGHALNNTLQDILIRYKRMDGFNALWLPGTDHAGIATQNVVEKQLTAQGLSRNDVGREDFIKRVWSWKEESGSTIISQLKKLGCSCDWTRERFTMDEGLSKVVREVFVRLYNEGLIYRGEYLINWCPRCLTALSDLEVIQAEEKGSLTYIAYPLEDKSGEIVVATTRAETLLGDTAVAVNPNDKRYTHLKGKRVLLPILGRPIPIIAEPQVDPEFGTGAVKITPGHDFKDFEIARIHFLPAINILDDNGAIIKDSSLGHFGGVERFEARKQIIKELENIGLLRDIKEHLIALGRCYRCQTVTEPMLKPQWFVKTKPLAEPVIEAVKKGRTRFVPSMWEATYFQWMENIRDWCISRQIWWGHRIPAWYCDKCGKITVSIEDPLSCSQCSSSSIHQDPDVLDTWFSSALWPFSTLGWPEKTKDFQVYYPTAVLVTSFDIIFFWVARMMMMGIKFTGQVPFRDVYIHALVRDISGKKMSKSRGNVIDPLFLMEKYGTDALRFTLIALAAQGRDIKISEERVAGYRNFANKIWNSARFVLMNIDDLPIGDPQKPPASLSLPDKWILTRLSRLIAHIRESLGSYAFDEAGRALYQFFWHEFCDWYLEMAKPAIQGKPEEKHSSQWTLLYVLEGSLRLLHPFMPFLTEEIWQKLPIPRPADSSIMVAGFPSTRQDLIFSEADDVERVISAISTVRTIRGETNVPLSTRLDITIRTPDGRTRDIFEENRSHILTLAKGKSLTITLDPPKPTKNTASAITAGVEVFVSLEGAVDINAEVNRLEKLIKKLDKECGFLNEKLANPKFLKNAPEEVIEEVKEKKVKAEKEKEAVFVSIGRLRSLR